MKVKSFVALAFKVMRFGFLSSEFRIDGIKRSDE
jgi:hypothetical protein